MRKMRRFKQELSKEKCIEILKKEPRGILSVIGEEGYPYGMPLNHWYCEEDGKLYFHGAKEGHKIDAIRACDKVSYCVYDEGFRREGEWALNISSVVVFGKMSIVEDEEKAEKICVNLAHKFTQDEDYIAGEVHRSLKHVMCLELDPVQITGKLVNES